MKKTGHRSSIVIFLKLNGLVRDHDFEGCRAAVAFIPTHSESPQLMKLRTFTLNISGLHPICQT